MCFIMPYAVFFRGIVQTNTVLYWHLVSDDVIVVHWNKNGVTLLGGVCVIVHCSCHSCCYVCLLMSMCNCVYVIESTEKLLYAGANLLHCLWSIIPANITLIIMAPYGIGQAIIFLPVVSSSIFYLSIIFPRLISAVVDWMSAILGHMVWP